ncbi:MAG: acyl-CoA thioesterase [Chloracidobacterium sp.]|nr:acyl-CoA thioesterase [Chloracidobacterium sp.]
MDEWHETEIRVRYAETDQMGIVHHANYLIWFETGRSELCRAKGFSYKAMEDEDDALMVVAESYCRYKSPAFYEDLLTIRTRVTEVRSRSLRFFYEVHRASDDTLIAEGETLHVVTDRNKTSEHCPSIYRDRLLDKSPKRHFPLIKHRVSASSTVPILSKIGGSRGIVNLNSELGTLN